MLPFFCCCFCLKRNEHYWCKCFLSSVLFYEKQVKTNTLAVYCPQSHERNLGSNANHVRCDVDPAQRSRKKLWTEGKYLAKESQRCTRPESQCWSQTCCSIHHRDEALWSDQSQSALHQRDSWRCRREGLSSPPAAWAGNATRRNTL